jgi:CRP-like cAMP-binding protein
MALLTGEPRNADVRAASEVETIEIRKAVLQQLLENNPALAEAFSKTITERQMRLAEYARAMPEEERRVQAQTVLRRIKRFFSLI